MTLLYMYRVSCDSGLAPCICDDLLTLACCKGGQIRNGKDCFTGLRYWIGEKRDADYAVDDVYILGTYHDKLLYLAKVTDVMKMEEYYSDEKYFDRLDNIYKVDNNSLLRNRKLRKENIHMDKLQQRRDANGKYVILSDDFIYLGENALEISKVKELGAIRQETKKYFDDDALEIISICLNHKDNKNNKPNQPIQRSCNQK